MHTYVHARTHVSMHAHTLIVRGNRHPERVNNFYAMSTHGNHSPTQSVIKRHEGTMAYLAKAPVARFNDPSLNPIPTGCPLTSTLDYGTRASPYYK